MSRQGETEGELLALAVRDRHEVFCPACLNQAATLRLEDPTRLMDLEVMCPTCGIVLGALSALSFPSDEQPEHSEKSVKGAVMDKWDAILASENIVETDATDGKTTVTIDSTAGLRSVVLQAANRFNWHYTPRPERPKVNIG